MVLRRLGGCARREGLAVSQRNIHGCGFLMRSRFSTPMRSLRMNGATSSALSGEDPEPARICRICFPAILDGWHVGHVFSRRAAPRTSADRKKIKSMTLRAILNLYFAPQHAGTPRSMYFATNPRHSFARWKRSLPTAAVPRIESPFPNAGDRRALVRRTQRTAESRSAPVLGHAGRLKMWLWRCAAICARCLIRTASRTQGGPSSAVPPSRLFARAGHDPAVLTPTIGLACTISDLADLFEPRSDTNPSRSLPIDRFFLCHRGRLSHTGDLPRAQLEHSRPRRSSLRAAT
jgi:hypothetical protein